MGVTLTVKDKGLEALTKSLKELSKLKVQVGYFDPETASIAAFNEFGTIHIPSRPFMRNAIPQGKAEIQEVAELEIGGVVEDGASPSSAMEEIGLTVKDQILKMLDTTRTWAKPNAPSTIKKKGPEYPPLDAGHQRLHEDLEVR